MQHSGPTKCHHFHKVFPEFCLPNLNFCIPISCILKYRVGNLLFSLCNFLNTKLRNSVDAGMLRYFNLADQRLSFLPPLASYVAVRWPFAKLKSRQEDVQRNLYLKGTKRRMGRIEKRLIFLSNQFYDISFKWGQSL